MRVVAHKNDGKGAITTPVILIAESELTSAEEHLAGIDPTLEPFIIEEDALPTTEFRNAWEIVGGEVKINMPAARDIFRKRIRGARMPKLAALDIEFQRALETGADTTEIVAKKQILRDAPSNPEIETAETVEALKLLWPDILN